MAEIDKGKIQAKGYAILEVLQYKEPRGVGEVAINDNKNKEDLTMAEVNAIFDYVKEFLSNKGIK